MIRTRSSIRPFQMAIAVGILALSGCATHPNAMQSPGADIAYSSVSSAPAVNPEFAARMAYNARAGHESGIQLGAGDRFGNNLHTRYMAMIQTRESNRRYADVPRHRNIDD